MLKLRELTLVSLLIVAVASACTPPGGPDIESVGISDISDEDAAAATVKSMSIKGAVEATLEAMAPEATEILLPDTVEQALAVFDFYLAQQNQVTDNRIRQVTFPCVGLCISDGT